MSRPRDHECPHCGAPAHLTARIEALEEALRPFAEGKKAGLVDGEIAWYCLHCGWSSTDVEPVMEHDDDCPVRRARTLLTGTHREPGQVEGSEEAPRTEATIRYHKACSCEDATASGPRIYKAGVTQVFDQTQFTFGVAAMVCDECDKPWKRVEEDPDV